MAGKKIPAKIQNEIKDYIDTLKKANLIIKEVYLYGSYAKGNQTQWSDIDLCVISPSFTNIYDATQYLWQKRKKDEGLTIEPVGFDPETFENSYSPLVGEIKNTGVKVV